MDKNVKLAARCTELEVAARAFENQIPELETASHYADTDGAAALIEQIAALRAEAAPLRALQLELSNQIDGSPDHDAVQAELAARGKAKKRPGAE